MQHNSPYDEPLAQIPGLRWQPWIGQDFGHTRRFVLGESHYHDGDGDWLGSPLATRALIANQGLQPDRFPSRDLMARIEQLLGPQPMSAAQREAFWQGLAYGNVVQRPMSGRAERPRAADFEAGWRCFLDVARVLGLREVLRLGYAGIGQLGKVLAEGHGGWEREDAAQFYAKPYDIGLRCGPLRLRLRAIPHPTGSRGFSAARWRAWLGQVG